MIQTIVILFGIKGYRKEDSKLSKQSSLRLSFKYLSSKIQMQTLKEKQLTKNFEIGVSSLSFHRSAICFKYSSKHLLPYGLQRFLKVTSDVYYF